MGFGWVRGFSSRRRSQLAAPHVWIPWTSCPCSSCRVATERRSSSSRSPGDSVFPAAGERLGDQCGAGLESGSVGSGGVVGHVASKQSASVEASRCLPLAFSCFSCSVSFSICFALALIGLIRSSLASMRCPGSASRRQLGVSINHCHHCSTENDSPRLDAGEVAAGEADGGLMSNAQDTKSGSGQSFRPRPTIDASMASLAPQLGGTRIDPSRATGGWLIARLLPIVNPFPAMTREQRDHLRHAARSGVEVVQPVIWHWDELVTAQRGPHRRPARGQAPPAAG